MVGFPCAQYEVGDQNILFCGGAVEAFNYGGGGAALEAEFLCRSLAEEGAGRAGIEHAIETHPSPCNGVDAGDRECL